MEGHTIWTSVLDRGQERGGEERRGEDRGEERGREERREDGGGQQREGEERREDRGNERGGERRGGEETHKAIQSTGDKNYHNATEVA